MSRHGFDGDKLGDDVARLTAEDKASPPAAQPSLMDAVRALAPFIETRTRLNWGDPKIAAVLSAAGYPIDAATLRSYRKRLRDEGLLPPLKGKTRNQPPPSPAPTLAGHPSPITPQPIPAAAPIHTEVGAAHPPAPVASPEADGAMSRDPPASAPAPTSVGARRFSIDPTKRPLDRA